MSNKIEKVKMFNQILESMVIQLSPVIGTTYHNKLLLIYNRKNRQIAARIQTLVKN